MKVTIQSKGEQYEFEADGSKTVLFDGLGHGVALPYACASGTCGTCKAGVLVGSVSDLWPNAPGKKAFKDPNQILLCQCLPRGDCVLTVSNSVAMTPPEALLPFTLDARVSSWQLLTHDVASWELELYEPMAYRAGQFVLVRFPDVEGARAYSIVNYEPGSRRLELLLKKKPGGGLSEVLFAANPIGNQVQVTGPLGAAVFKPEAAQDVLCIAGGSGVAGMISILEQARDIHYFPRMNGYLFFGVRSARDVFFLGRLALLANSASGALKITICLSDGPVPDDLRERYPELLFAQGFVHEVALDQMIGRLGNVHAFLAGPPPAVDAAMRGLMLKGKLNPQSMSSDKFS